MCTYEFYWKKKKKKPILRNHTVVHISENIISTNDAEYSEFVFHKLLLQVIIVISAMKDLNKQKKKQNNGVFRNRESKESWTLCEEMFTKNVGKEYRNHLPIDG